MPATCLSRRVALAVPLVLAVVACGGGGTDPVPPPPPPPPTPVANVTVDPGTAVLAPQQTQQLTATPRDAQGNPLSGRTVTWTTSAQAVASVSTAGLVTAAGTGTATITATSEGRSGSATITVAAGTVVGPQGGTVTLGNGAVTITVPAGAVTTPVVINATVGGALPGAPPADQQVVGPIVSISPAGTTFAQPVTVQVKFAATDLPGFAMAGDLNLHQWNGSQWLPIPNATVSAGDYTISAAVTRLGSAAGGPAASGGAHPTGEPASWDVALMAMDPHVSLSPGDATVNVFQRYAGFHVSVAPRGQGIGLLASAAPLLFRWRTDGPHSTFIESIGPNDWTETTAVEYLNTDPNLADLSGDIDRVVVDVCLSAPDCTGSAARVISLEAVIKAGNAVDWAVFPGPLTVKRGDDLTLRAARKDSQGQELALPALRNQPYVQEWDITWTSTEFYGDLDELADPKVPTIVYTAHDHFQFPPPRREKVAFAAYVVETFHARVLAPLGPTGGKVWTTQSRTTRTKVGEAEGTLVVETDYTLALTVSNANAGPGDVVQVIATLDPPEPTGVAYRFTSAGSQGTLTPASGTLSPASTITYKVNEFPSGGDEVIRVDVVSIVQGAVWDVLTPVEEVTVAVDPTRAVQLLIHSFINVGGGTGVVAYLLINKVPGATTYQVTSQGFPEPLLPLTFSSPNTTGLGIPVGSIVDEGGRFRVTLRSGTCPPGVVPCGHIAGYQSFYGGYAYRVKATP